MCAAVVDGNWLVSFDTCPWSRARSEKRMLGMALVRLPTESVEVDDHHALVAPGGLAQIEWAIDAPPGQGMHDCRRQHVEAGRAVRWKAPAGAFSKGTVHVGQRYIDGLTGSRRVVG